MTLSRSEQILRNSRAWKGWVVALRPKTLSAAVVPVTVASALGYFVSGIISPVVTCFALLFAVAIQVATNFINDCWS